MRYLSRDCQEGCQGLEKQGPQEIPAVLKRTQTSKGVPERALFQKNYGTINMNKNPSLQVRGIVT
jgi:hypothetical protein